MDATFPGRDHGCAESASTELHHARTTADLDASDETTAAGEGSRLS